MMWWNGWEFHWLWMVGFWSAFILLIVWAVTRLTSTDRGDRSHGARDVLDERYARGEVDDDEYRRRRRELERGPG